MSVLGISFLKSIDLSFNEFGDQGAKFLAQVIQVYNLFTLFIIQS